MKKMQHMEIDEAGTRDFEAWRKLFMSLRREFLRIEYGDLASRKPLPYLGVSPVRFWVFYLLPEGATFYCSCGESILILHLHCMRTRSFSAAAMLRNGSFTYR